MIFYGIAALPYGLGPAETMSLRRCEYRRPSSFFEASMTDEKKKFYNDDIRTFGLELLESLLTKFPAVFEKHDQVKRQKFLPQSVERLIVE